MQQTCRYTAASGYSSDYILEITNDTRQTQIQLHTQGIHANFSGCTLYTRSVLF